MRIAALVLITALAACNPSAPSGQAGDNGLFPNLTNAQYRAESIIHGDNGEALPVVMYRSGTKTRMEMQNEQGAATVVADASTGEHFVLINQGGRLVAMRANASDYDNPAQDWGGEYAETATRTGSCSVAGENGSEWTRTGDDSVARSACVTSDGIILQAREGDRVTWETTSVQRGPQDAALFELPEGVQVMDLGAMAGAAQEAAKQARGNPQVCAALREHNAPADVISRAGC